MEYPSTHQARSKQPDEDRKPKNSLKYTFDAHFFPTTPPDDDFPKSTDSDDSIPESSESRYSNQSASLVAGIQFMANSMVRMEMAELEMMKRREMARLQAQKRQTELEDEMIQMMLQTQTQIASLVSRNNSSKKRRNSGGDDNTSKTYKFKQSSLLQ